MDVIRLIPEATGRSQSNRLYINGKDIGILYLTEDEHAILETVLTTGGESANVHVDVPKYGADEEIDVDIFDEYD